MCYALDEARALFTGDHVMGWSTTIVSPPDGDMRSYIESLRKVQGRADSVLWPTHGAPVTDPAPFLQAYLDHRLEREAHVLEMVRAGVTKIVDIVDILYVDVKPELHKPARRSVLAHLVKLVADGQVACNTDRPRVRSVQERRGASHGRRRRPPGGPPQNRSGESEPPGERTPVRFQCQWY